MVLRVTNAQTIEGTVRMHWMQRCSCAGPPFPDPFATIQGEEEIIAFVQETDAIERLITLTAQGNPS